MILWKFREHLEMRHLTDPSVNWPCRAFRAVLCLERHGTAVRSYVLGVFHQYQMKDTGEWHTGHTDVASVSVQGLRSWRHPRHWKWEEDHFWYDGPHCLYSFGPFHVQLDRWRDCKQCAGAR